MQLHYIALWFVFIVGICESIPVQPYSKSDSLSLSVIDFMKKYGYLERGLPDSEALYNKSAIIDAVKTLQSYGNIPITGQMDDRTLELITAPRCGVSDISRKAENSRRKKRCVVESKH